MGNGLTGWVLKHLEKSHEGLEIKEIIRSKLQRREKAQEMTGIFAAGCGFYKLFWLFFLGSFLGDITETIFCWWKDAKLLILSFLIGLRSRISNFHREILYYVC